MKKKLVKLSALALAAVLIFSGCGAHKSSASAKNGGTLKFGLATEPTSIDPAKSNGTAGYTIEQCIYNGLLGYDSKGNIVNQLAESYQVSSDGKTYTFKLKDVKFQNGDALTADDVKFTFDRILDPKTGAFLYTTMKSLISSTEVVDSKTIQFNLKIADSAFLGYVASPYALIVSKSWTTQKPDLTKYPMGTGPYSFVTWTKGQSVEVKKNSAYYQSGATKLDGIKFVIYNDDTARVNAIKTGDVDVIEYVPAKDTASLISDTSKKVYKLTALWTALEFNCKSAPFDNVKVRQAIAYAVNREDILAAAFSKRGAPLYGLPITKDMPGYKNNFFSYYKVDLNKAKSLLAEAGYPNGFKCTLMATSQYDYFIKTAVCVQSDLKKIGIDVTIDSPDFTTQGIRSKKGDFQFMVRGNAPTVSDPEWMALFYQSGAASNLGLYSNAKMDQLLVQGMGTSESKARLAVFAQAEQLALDDAPYVFLSYRELAYATTDKVGGFYYNSYFAGTTALTNTYFTK